MTDRAAIHVTERDRPAQEESPLRRWFDQKRWKFGPEEWFGTAEATLNAGDVLEAHRIAADGVAARLRGQPPPSPPPLVWYQALNASLLQAQGSATCPTTQAVRPRVPPAARL